MKWKNDLYDGIGQLYFSETSWIKAEFKKGKCQSIICLQNGSYINMFGVNWINEIIIKINQNILNNNLLF